MRKSHTSFLERFKHHASDSILGSFTKDSVVTGLVFGAAKAGMAHSYNAGLEAAGELSEGRKQALTFAEKIVAQKNDELKEVGKALPQNSR